MFLKNTLCIYLVFHLNMMSLRNWGCTSVRIEQQCSLMHIQTDSLVAKNVTHGLELISNLFLKAISEYVYVKFRKKMNQNEAQRKIEMDILWSLAEKWIPIYMENWCMIFLFEYFGPDGTNATISNKYRVPITNQVWRNISLDVTKFFQLLKMIHPFIHSRKFMIPLPCLLCSTYFYVPNLNTFGITFEFHIQQGYSEILSFFRQSPTVVLLLYELNYLFYAFHDLLEDYFYISWLPEEVFVTIKNDFIFQIDKMPCRCK